MRTTYDMKIQRAEAILQQHNTTFGFDTKQIINLFNQVKHLVQSNLSSFIKTGENLNVLCGDIYELRNF